MILKDLKEKFFIKHLIKNLNGEVYVVGGFVRDFLLKKPNKDIDLVVRLIKLNILISELKKFGKLDIVGESFGVIKFISNEDGLEYDIALPRVEIPTGEGGHKGFKINSNENLPIKDDLSRRDAKINSIAYSINNNIIIDPLGGLEDLKNKLMSMTNPNSFNDDPLRMLRMVGFSSRFNFTIEPNTMKMIQSNTSKISEIAGERIYIELEKIVTKGDKRLGAQLLKDTGLFQYIFGFELDQSVIDNSPFDDVRTIGEYIFLLISNLENPAEVFRMKLKGDINSVKEIEALSIGFNNVSDNHIKNRVVAHKMFTKSPNSINSRILPDQFKRASEDLNSGQYPKSIKELFVNGNDLMNLGLKGKELGDTLKSLLVNIYGDKVKNNEEDLLNLIKTKYNE